MLLSVWLPYEEKAVSSTTAMFTHYSPTGPWSSAGESAGAVAVYAARWAGGRGTARPLASNLGSLRATPIDGGDGVPGRVPRLAHSTRHPAQAVANPTTTADPFALARRL